MFKIIGIIFVAITLTACSTTRQPIQEVPQFNYTPINPTWIDCGTHGKVNMPNPDTLTDAQIVSYMSKLDNFYQECIIDAASVRAWEAALKQKIQELNAKG